MTNSQQRATSLLQHYLKFGFDAAGYRWDSDNQSEVADIVDSIIDAATPPRRHRPSRHWIRTQSSKPGNGRACSMSACQMPYGIEFGGEDSALTRIAIALERISEKLDMLSANGVDYAGDPISVLRVDTGT